MPTPPPLPPFAAPVPGGQGLPPEGLQQISEAQARSRKIARAITYARFDGWTIAVFAVLTFLGGLMHWVGFVLGVGMGLIAWVELGSATRLQRLDPAAPRALAINQVALGVLLLSYAVYSLWGTFRGPSAISSQLAAYPELTTLAGDVESLARLIGVAIYGALIAVAIFAQGGAALFYLSRRKHIEAHLRETPQWILDAQRAGMRL